MSSAFVKEGDQEEVPIVPARANLPAGVTNYVTLNGFKQLQSERNALVEEQNTLKARSDEDNRVQINFITANLISGSVPLKLLILQHRPKMKCTLAL